MEYSRPKKEKDLPKGFSQDRYPNKGTDSQGGGAAKTDVSQADSEAVIHPQYKCKQQKQAVCRGIVTAAKGAKKIVKQSR